MADGFTIEIAMPRMAGGEPLLSVWYAHIPDEVTAIEAVRAASGATINTQITVVGPVRHEVLIGQLRVPEGEVRLGP